MRGKPGVSIVGAGSLATSLGLALRAAGYRIEEIISRASRSSRRRAERLARSVGARAVTRKNARLESKVIWFAVNDDAIDLCAREFAAAIAWRGKIALHSSGALGSSELATLERRGASVASAHPMMTFVAARPRSLRGVLFAVEGGAGAARAASAIARDLGAFPFSISREHKTLYHAVGSFSSPLLVALLATAERIARSAGISRSSLARLIHPILAGTVENYMKNGAGAAFSGPIRRGDVSIVSKHLLALKKIPEARAVYVALLRAALRELPVKNRGALQRLAARTF